MVIVTIDTKGRWFGKAAIQSGIAEKHTCTTGEERHATGKLILVVAGNWLRSLLRFEPKTSNGALQSPVGRGAWRLEYVLYCVWYGFGFSGMITTVWHTMTQWHIEARLAWLGCEIRVEVDNSYLASYVAFGAVLLSIILLLYDYCHYLRGWVP